MITILLISSIIFGYSFYCVVREIIKVNDGILDEKHQKVHISILMYLLVFHLVFAYWFIFRKGFEIGFDINKIDRDFSVLVLILAQLSTSITRHFRKERLGENILLNYKKEIKRTFSK